MVVPPPRFLRERLQYGFITDAPTYSSHLRVIANPAPLGLFSFASTTLILSMINVQARHVVEVRTLLFPPALSPQCLGIKHGSNVLFHSPTLSSEWPSLAVAWLNSSLACGSSSAVRLLPRPRDRPNSYFIILGNNPIYYCRRSLCRQHLRRNCFLVLRCFLDRVRENSIILIFVCGPTV